jgi:hypothetical protein
MIPRRSKSNFEQCIWQDLGLQRSSDSTTNPLVKILKEQSMCHTHLEQMSFQAQ